MSYFQQGRLTVSGFPSAGQSITVGVRFDFVPSSQQTTTSTQIPVDTGQGLTAFRQLMADVINGADGVGATAAVSGSDLVVTPQSGQGAGSVVVTSAASNITAAGITPDPDGAIESE
jgi:hypothetical protein